jgi:phosphoglycerate kinase
MGAPNKIGVEALDLRGKRVLLRVDFNVPLTGEAIRDDSRIRAALPTLEHCLAHGASVVLASHLGRPGGVRQPQYSLKPVAFRLEELLGRGIPLAPDCVGPVCETLTRTLRPGDVLLLENLRFHAGEERNDPEFAAALARLADCYVNDAFSVSHRAHASISAVTRFLQPAVAGLLMQRELAALRTVTEQPRKPVVVVLGGAKIADKLGVIRGLVKKADRLLLGGAMAFTFLRACDCETGFSVVDLKLVESAKAILAEASARGVEIVLPEDFVVAAHPDDRTYVSVRPAGQIPCATMGLDIGPATVARFRAALRDAGTILWNGPMGMWEQPRFAIGTMELARAVADTEAVTVAGGGDTVAAIERAGVATRFAHLSMGGGAFLQYLEGVGLPGITALTDVASTPGPWAAA